MPTKVLIVDDNEHLRNIFRTVLQSAGYQVVQAASGCEAIEKARSSGANLVIMDIDLPDMTGLDAMRAIRKDNSQLPIIGLSAFFAREWKEKALAAGMMDFLEKPVSAEILRSKIEAYARVVA
jgi:CheY-like chemotaxis protein